MIRTFVTDKLAIDDGSAESDEEDVDIDNGDGCVEVGADTAQPGDVDMEDADEATGHKHVLSLESLQDTLLPGHKKRGL